VNRCACLLFDRKGRQTDITEGIIHEVITVPFTSKINLDKFFKFKVFLNFFEQHSCESEIRIPTLQGSSQDKT
jgi:hypothetical protein